MIDGKCKAFTALSFKFGKPKRCSLPALPMGPFCPDHQRVFDQGGDLVVLTRKGELI